MSDPTGRSHWRVRLTIALALAALAALPSVASAAGTVSTSGTTITYTGDTGVNDLTVDDTGTDDYQFTETGIGETSSICTDSGDTINCDDGSWNFIIMNLAGGNDSMNAVAVNDPTDFDNVRVDGGIGDDTIVFPDAAAGNFDVGSGGEGNDTFGLGGGTGAGADAMSGGPGDDVFNGGASAADFVAYSQFNGSTEGCTEANPSITFDHDGVADDQGCSSETGDLIKTDVEGIQGSSGDDTITGGPNPDLLWGDGGNDRLEGGAGSDRLAGGTGIDRALYVNGCTDSISITLDGTGFVNDGGCNGETETVSPANGLGYADIESVTGSQFADSITGSCFPNAFAGSAGTAEGSTDGNDTFNGDPNGCLAATTDGTEADFMGGGEGNDVFNGDGSGNPGLDTVTYGIPYTGHAVSVGAPCAVSGNRAVSVTFDDTANDCDGFGNTADNVNGDINRLIGSPLADSLDGGPVGPRVPIRTCSCSADSATTC